MNTKQKRSNSSIKASLPSPSSQELDDQMVIHLGDGWCSFPDLDNFDTDKLLRALTLKESATSDSVWDPSLPFTESHAHTIKDAQLSVTSLRQLEALFNLTQLLYGLSRSETVNYTFRDLQFKRYPHSFIKSGFKLMSRSRVDFYKVFEQLVALIIEQGGLEVAFLMYRNPVLPMVRQKCLDLIANVATVPQVAYKLIVYQSWLLDHLLMMIRDGDIVSDKIPALSVLIRLLKIMLTERMITAYSKLVDMQFIDFVVDAFQDRHYTESAEHLPFFVKFEFICMQSLTVILGDAEYCALWSDKAKVRLINYCMIVLLKAVGAYPLEQTVNHIYYAEKHTNKHSLAHTLMTITELLRNDANMKFFYRYHKPFKQLIIQLYKKYGAKSEFSRIEPGISYALNHLMRALYVKSGSGSVGPAQQTRVCANVLCHNEETKFKEFRECDECDKDKVAAAYCSRKCLKTHLIEHLQSSGQQQQKVGVECIHHSLSRTKRLSKYSSMNEHHRRTSLTMSRAKNVYAKHTSSMKEIKSKETFVRPLKTSTQLCLTELTHVNSSSSSSGSEQPSKKLRLSSHFRRHSDAADTVDDIEEERYEVNEARTRGSTNPVESPENSDFNNLDSSSSANADEHEFKSKFKVVKEFEKQLEFYNNGSSLILIGGSDKKSDDTLTQPHISLSSLCYDKDNTNIEMDSSDDDDEDDDHNGGQDGDDDDDDDDDDDADGDDLIERKKPKVNLIINNSVASQVSRLKEEFVDDEMSLFKNETLHKNKTSDYVTFKKPLLPDQPKKQADPLPLSLQPVHIQSNEYLLKNNKIYNELKVFKNIANLDTTNATAGASVELPKNSTPIYSDNSTAAYLTAKRKKLLNGKLDLTIAPALTDNKVAKENFVTSTLRSSNNLQASVKKSSKLLNVPGETLDLSKLSAIENASANLINVAKADFPDHIKKKFKDEIKKDKTKCLIQ